MLVVAYNPSLEDLAFVEVVLPHPYVEISYWNAKTMQFEKVEKAEALCYKAPEDNNECDVFVKHTTLALSLTVLRIKKSITSIEVPPNTNEETIKTSTI